MGSSIETPKNLEIVCGAIAYDEEKEQIECPPTTVNNRKKILAKGRPALEGEMAITLGRAKYEKDENGKIVNVEFLENKKNAKVQEETR